MQPFAFSSLGLRPWELLRFTPREFGYLVEGWQAQQERERFRSAQLACWLLAPQLGKGKTLTPQQLLGLDRREDL